MRYSYKKYYNIYIFLFNLGQLEIFTNIFTEKESRKK